MTIWPSGELATTPPAIDPLVSLAVNMLAAPGTYAILAGSGLSRAAGIMTGDEVLCDLITRVAKAEGAEVGQAGWDPKGWWVSKHDSEPAYDQLIATLARTDAMRRHLLGPYFEPTPARPGFAQPTEAHRAIARLCARGLVKVILTTNFDRLIEQALDDQKIRYQIAHDEEMLPGLAPLVHAPITVFKLNGDYRQGRMRNSTEELLKYPAKLKRHLERVLEDFGILAVGWSAQYDVALSKALRARSSRRYPFYWGAYLGQVDAEAKEILVSRDGHTISHQGADQFFRDLEERLDRLVREAAASARPARQRGGMGIILYHDTQVLDGWDTLPLLRLEVAAQVVGEGECDIIRAGDREAFRNALNASAVRFHLTGMALQPPAPAGISLASDLLGGTIPFPQPVPGLWEPNPSHDNNSDQANYRLGGDASDGVSALAMAQLPRASAAGSSTKFILEMGISLRDRLQLEEVALILRDALLLATVELPRTMARALPAQAGPIGAEIRIRAKAKPTTVSDNVPGPIANRINFAPFGERQTRGEVTAWAYGLHLNGGAPTAAEVGEAVVDALELLAYDLGYQDPRKAIGALRQRLGLAPEP